MERRAWTACWARCNTLTIRPALLGAKCVLTLCTLQPLHGALPAWFACWRLPQSTECTPAWAAPAGRTGGTGSQGQHTRRVVEGDVCWFCLNPADPSVPGKLAVLHKTSPSLFGGHSILYHEACVGYSNTDRNGMLQAAIDARRDRDHVLKDKEVVAEWGRCQHLPCAVCGQLGASICCCLGTCARMMHFTCARLSAQGKPVPEQLPLWPSGRAVFAEDTREVACPDHGKRYVALGWCIACFACLACQPWQFLQL